MSQMKSSLDVMSDAGGIDALAIDVTGNGGGSEWAVDVARLFTRKHLASPPTSFVKHPHWEKQIENHVSALQRDLAIEGLSEELSASLSSALDEHELLLTSITRGCDSGSLWDSSDAQVTCERLAEDPHGMLMETDFETDSVQELQSRRILFPTIRHPDFVGLYDGPLFILIDGASASATEQFATLLQYNKVATVVGERSYGAGCGYTNGGIKVYLPNTHLRVWMSDCMRKRADGENELAGIEPDLAGWPKGTKGKAKAQHLMESLAGHPGW